MTDTLLQKLYKQAIAKVEKELEAEKEVRVKKYMTTAIKTLVKTNIITPEEAKAAALKFKLQPSSVTLAPTRKSTNPQVRSVGCGGMSSNRC